MCNMLTVLCVVLGGSSVSTAPGVVSSRVVMDSGVIEGGLNVTLTIRLLMHGKEVGSIIGKVRVTSYMIIQTLHI